MHRKVGHKEKKSITKKISDILQKKDNVIFAYIYGSFTAGGHFNDIDVGIYISGNSSTSPVEIELDNERELGDLIHIPVDVRILNYAPLSFVYQVLKGGMTVVDKNRDVRADFESITYKKYFDFRHLRNEYLREVTNAPV